MTQLASRFLIAKLESLDANQGSHDYSGVLIRVDADLQTRIDQAHAIIKATPGIDTIGLNVIATVLAGSDYTEHHDIDLDEDDFEERLEAVGEIDGPRWATEDEADELSTLEVENCEGMTLVINGDQAPEFRCYTEGAHEYFSTGDIELLTPTARRTELQERAQAGARLIALGGSAPDMADISRRQAQA